MKSNTTKQRILNAILFGAGGAILSKGILILFNMIIARLISPSQYGVYSLINNTVQTFTIFAGAGLGATMSRYVALYGDKDKNLAGILIKTLLLFNILISGIVSLVVFFLANTVSDLISDGVDIAPYLRITSITIFLTSVASILQSILQGFEQFKKIALYQLISSFAMVIVGIIATLFIGTTGAIIGLLVFNLALCTFLALSSTASMRKNSIVPKFEINDTVKKSIKNVAIPAFLSSIFVMPITWIANSVFTNNNGYEEFAAFSICLQWFTILNYLPQQLGQVKPIYTRLYADNKIDEFKQIVRKMITTSIVFSAIASVILAIFSSLLLRFYGDYYLNYILPFIIMLITSIFYSVQSQFGSIFYAIGKIWLSFMLNVIWAVVFFAIFMTYGKDGTLEYTITYCVSYIIYSGVSVFFFYKITK